MEGNPGGGVVEVNFVAPSTAEVNSEPQPIPLSIPDLPPKFSKALCIFCASICPASFTILNGKVIRIVQEEPPPVVNDNENEEKGEDSQPPVPEVGIIERQLRSLFIIRRILDVGPDLCSKLLGDFDGSLDPEHWVNVCDECQSPVYEFYQAQMEVSKLETKMTRIKTKMKEIIKESGNEISENPAPGEMEDISFTVWRGIRNETMRVFDEPPPPVSAPEMTPDKNHGPIFTFSGNTISIEEFKVISNFRTKRKSQESVEPPSKKRPPAVIPPPVKVHEKVVEVMIPQPPPLPPQDNNQPSSSASSDVTFSQRSQRPIIFYKCDKCGALVKGKKERINRHIELHNQETETGMKGMNCEICKWLVNERSLTTHNYLWHSERTRNLSFENVVIRPFSTWKLPRVPNYVARRQNNRRTVYVCTHCKGLTLGSKKMMEEHSKLHDMKGGNICLACGWRIAPGKMRVHVIYKHNENLKRNKLKLRREAGAGTGGVDEAKEIVNPSENEQQLPSQPKSPEPSQSKPPEPLEPKSPEPSQSKPPEPHQSKSPEPSQPEPAESNQPKSPELSQPKSPQPSHSKSPQSSQPKSPEPSDSISPQSTQPKSPEPSHSKSPQPSQSKSPQPSQSKSPQPERLHKCDDCGELFKTKRRLQIHRELEGGNNNNLEPCIAKRLQVILFNCDRCGISFKREAWLESHKKMVHMDGTFDKSFDGKKNGRRTPKASTNKKSGETPSPSSTQEEIVVIDLE
ncbi:unnamed protein product [Orchesella dallaii]|uniref:C2H2-type domain-containing protein n=1 Tax=Orchesella dallaii TaxID=48710 RepID=A0ABP1RTY1_9HEXA